MAGTGSKRESRREGGKRGVQGTVEEAGSGRNYVVDRDRAKGYSGVTVRNGMTLCGGE